MEYRRLGRTDLNVSVICLGSMTWGEQNTEADGHAQLDYAVAHGVNFIDTAEMYSTPPRKETYGSTERIIGTWLAKRGKRDDVIIASKVLGRAQRFPYARPHLHGGETRLDRQSVVEACDASLKRLQTDYIDLYQLHWPDRDTNTFAKMNYEHNPEDEAVPLLETLEALDDLVKAGKVRHVAVSNETPWGVMSLLRLSEVHGLPRIMSIQNPYSLLNRAFEVGLAEVAIREEVGLLAYSPLGMGVLSGKYLDGKKPEGARMTKFADYYGRYVAPRAVAATEKYVALARKHGMDPAQMANAFVNDRPFTTANIIGATSLEQLKSNIDSINLKLSKEVLDEIDEINRQTPSPVLS